MWVVTTPGQSRGEQDNAGLVGEPEVFPAAERGVLRFGEEAVEVFEKLGQAREGVGDDAVPVIGQEADRVQQDAGLGGGHCQAVADELIGAARRFQQKLPLGAAARDQIAPSRQDLPRCRHRCVSVNWFPSCVLKQCGRLGLETSR